MCTPTGKATAIVNKHQLAQKTAGCFRTRRIEFRIENFFSGKTVHRVAIGYSLNNYRFFVFRLFVSLTFCLRLAMICLSPCLSFPGVPWSHRCDQARVISVIWGWDNHHPPWLEPFNKGEVPITQALDNPIQDNDILDGHDIALIRLSREVTLSDTVWPACLPGGFSLVLCIHSLS